MSIIKDEEYKIKKYGLVVAVITLAFQHGLYALSNFLAGAMQIEPFLPKIDCIDDAIPLVTVFILPYVWSYVYWACAPLVASRCDYDHYLDYIATFIFACLFGAVILTFFPTYMDRAAEGLLDLPKDNFFNRIVLLGYDLDGGKMAFNLFPSYHCLISTVCYLAVAGRKEVPLSYRIYSLAITLTICASTVLVKQHYAADILGGVGIAVITFALCKKFRAGRIFMRPMNFIRKKLKEYSD